MLGLKAGVQSTPASIKKAWRKLALQYDDDDDDDDEDDEDDDDA